MDAFTIAGIATGVPLLAGGAVALGIAYRTSPQRAAGDDGQSHGGAPGGDYGYPAPEQRDPSGADMRAVAERIIARPDFGRSAFKAPRGDMSAWRAVPLLPRVRTRWAPHVSVSGAVFKTRNSAIIRPAVEGIKRACVAAGYPDVDPRPLYELFRNESGWLGGACWWRNAGNIKLNWGCRATAETLRAGQLYIPNGVVGCVGAWVVVDRARSSDAYYAFDSFASSMRFHLGVMFTQWHNDIYRRRGLLRPIDYLRQGTRDGAIQFANCLGNWYSGARPETRMLDASRFWDTGMREFPDWWSAVR